MKKIEKKSSFLLLKLMKIDEEMEKVSNFVKDATYPGVAPELRSYSDRLINKSAGQPRFVWSKSAVLKRFVWYSKVLVRI
jgi:hypothetical protein